MIICSARVIFYQRLMYIPGNYRIGIIPSSCEQKAYSRMDSMLWCRTSQNQALFKHSKNSEVKCVFLIA